MHIERVRAWDEFQMLIGGEAGGELVACRGGDDDMGVPALCLGGVNVERHREGRANSNAEVHPPFLTAGQLDRCGGIVLRGFRIRAGKDSLSCLKRSLRKAGDQPKAACRRTDTVLAPGIGRSRACRNPSKHRTIVLQTK